MILSLLSLPFEFPIYDLYLAYSQTGIIRIDSLVFHIEVFKKVLDSCHAGFGIGDLN